MVDMPQTLAAHGALGHAFVGVLLASPPADRAELLVELDPRCCEWTRYRR